jgi:hypothetical protein
MQYLLSAWLGALAGTVLAVAVYVPAIRILERRLRAGSGPHSAEQREAFEDKLSLLRRLILGTAIAMLAALGYWIGNAIGAAQAGAAPPLR